MKSTHNLLYDFVPPSPHTHTYTHMHKVLCTGQPCTVWTFAPVQTDPASLTNPGGTPLGFRSLILPGAGSQNPTRCVRVFYDNTTNPDYISVLVSEMHACQRKLCKFVS